MMIPTSRISDQQFLKAREHQLPVTVIDSRTFVLPSLTRPQLTEHHRIEFDTAEAPREFSCSCEAAAFNTPCWAAARALDVLLLFAAHNIHLPDRAAEVEDAVTFERPMPASLRFEHRREFKVEREGDADARPAPSRPRRTGTKVGAFSI